tara:strand:+ start:244 stop:1623 length:1380 start_codon:yes stop_codon:yes gene_type:complete
MATYNSGQVKFGTPGSQFVDSSTNTSSRRLYDFSDRVADLAPEESPFFVYLSKVGKVPTSDSQFRFLEDRTKVSITDRSFLQKGGGTLPAPGSTVSLTFDTSGGEAVSWLIKGMVVQFAQNTNTVTGDLDTNENLLQAIGRIESVSHGSSDTTCTVTSIQSVDGSTTTLDNNGECVVIGTSYEQGSGAPDVWSQELDNDYGYTQIFKTACEMSNTARATVYRGYADEWARLWNLKLREHKIDIERAMLFGQRASSSGIQYTEGIAGHIMANGQGQTKEDSEQLEYTEGQSYLKTVAAGSLTYDVLLRDLEVVFDPARGGSSSKLALCSLPVISLFNKLGDGAGFVGDSIVNGGGSRYNFNASQGTFGHKIMKVETVHGDLSLVKEPLFRGMSGEFMCMVDLDHVSYRPLVGNGVNRDTSITTNVQQADEDLRKDMILTEAGLEVTLPETHALFNFEEAL